MNQNILLLFALVFSSIQAKTQSLSLYPADTVFGSVVDNQFTEIKIKFLNNTSDSLVLNWITEEITLVSGWDYSLCDFGKCYTGVPHNGTMTKMGPMDTAFLKLNINALSITGTGYVRFRVSPFTGEDYLATIIVNALVSGLDKFSNNMNFSLSPIPANNQLNIQFAAPQKQVVTIFDCSGDMVKTEFLSHGNNPVSIEDLPAGMYFLSLENNVRQTEMRKFIIAR